jgi:RNA 2',3'-cyclic 3'-phosphodiesterase
VRLFLAINLEPDVRRAIVDATASLRAAAPTLSWVDEARLHLTLKFLGEHPPDVVRSLSESVSRVTERHRPFSMHLGEIGAFPNFRRARVVWMGIEREPRLELLHHDIELACEQLGFELDGRAFLPHLTLARVKGGDRTEEDELRRLARASKRVEFEQDADVQSVDVMKSDMTVTPSRYERLHTATLRST